ncbi:GNAT family N-acetyltransferase, partial [Xanthovirga aplysinae]|uniref:GNAT family N-acetyltransferase n=1 Tax=Xanthovirga aplysinae TaxID=2529853 RepID=UPI0012BB49BC
LALLKELNEEYQHIVAKVDEEVIGYVLVMLKKFSEEIPVLLPMFCKIDELSFEGTPLKDANYFVMGQVCIAKEFRGKSIFYRLYEGLKKQMSDDFTYVITEVATRNRRSIRAHEKIGFKTILQYNSELGEKWDIMLWNWK